MESNVAVNLGLLLVMVLIAERKWNDFFHSVWPVSVVILARFPKNMCMSVCEWVVAVLIKFYALSQIQIIWF